MEWSTSYSGARSEDWADTLAMWEYEKRNGSLPDGSDTQTEQLQSIAHTIWDNLGINKKGIPEMDKEVIRYVSFPLSAPSQPPSLPSPIQLSHLISSTLSYHSRYPS